MESSSIEEMRAVIGANGDAVVASLVESFVRTTAERLDSARTAIAWGDVAELTRICHSIRGAAATFGAGQLAAIAYELETTARRREIEPAGLLNRLAAEFEAVARELTGVLADNAAR